MGESISQRLLALLEEIVENHKLDLPLKAVQSGEGLDEIKRELLIDALVAELSNTGLRIDDEPNERGLQIEELIDFVNRNRGRTG